MLCSPNRAEAGTVPGRRAVLSAAQVSWETLSRCHSKTLQVGWSWVPVMPALKQLRENHRQPLSAVPLLQKGTASFRNICKARKHFLYLLSMGQSENNNAGLISVWCVPWASLSLLRRSCRQQRMVLYYLRNDLSRFKGTSSWGKWVHTFACILAQYLHWFYCKIFQILV